jgi:hypothetical protein
MLSERKMLGQGKKRTFCVQHIQSEYLIVLELEQEKTKHAFSVQHILSEHLILLEIIEPITAIKAELLCYVHICVLYGFVGFLSPNA